MRPFRFVHFVDYEKIEADLQHERQLLVARRDALLESEPDEEEPDDEGCA